ncbi:transcriptional regulator [Streptomyces sp. RKND-216]|uniref:helix-turn-helix domain-containing protein n=1 Tax=Streptomyces sp. RKND-216 TaxID=2562581 RepID=UPI00109E2D85|nr:helix-turn-helix transcriptional regulator [Streptomyces sp. RKND-216]THA27545.1 transcriptional regulator [Streptomyces sp. RKND-216]
MLSGNGRCKDLARELRALRGRSGLTLAALAERTCYSKSSWERYLNGKSVPPEAAVRAFASAVGVPPGRLLVLHGLAETNEERTGAPAEPEPEASGPPGGGRATGARRTTAGRDRPDAPQARRAGPVHTLRSAHGRGDGNRRRTAPGRRPHGGGAGGVLPRGGAPDEPGTRMCGLRVQRQGRGTLRLPPGGLDGRRAEGRRTVRRAAVQPGVPGRLGARQLRRRRGRGRGRGTGGPQRPSHDRLRPRRLLADGRRTLPRLRARLRDPGGGADGVHASRRGVPRPPPRRRTRPDPERTRSRDTASHVPSGLTRRGKPAVRRRPVSSRPGTGGIPRRRWGAPRSSFHQPRRGGCHHLLGGNEPCDDASCSAQQHWRSRSAR